jgi:PadR family transcriptional regulator PadR
MKKANLHILEGTLYPLLTRLKNAELLTYRWVESSSGPKIFLSRKRVPHSTVTSSLWDELANAVHAITQNGQSISSNNFNQ